ncbi:MAG: nucleotidyltransferase family protein [Eubacteriales bacterium]
MTNEFEYLMYLFSCGARGIKATNPIFDVNYEKVISLAKEQSIYHTVLFALKMMDYCVLPDAELAVLFSQLKNDTITAYIRRVKIIKLLEDFEAAGICVVLLKGYGVASLYALPDSRMSGDVDIYVDPKDEKRGQALLKQNGFKVVPRDTRSHHSECEHSELGHLELHVKLYAKIVEEVWFKDNDGHALAIQPYVKISTDEGYFYTLGKTDNLIFLALHMIKHFITGGISLRLIMDFSLFFYVNNSTVDFIRFWSTMENLNYKYLIEVILSIAVKHFGFNSDSLPYNIIEIDENNIEVVLNDLETGGWLGTKEHDTRNEGWNEYNRLKFIHNKSNRNYIFYMFLWSAESYIKSMFPSRQHLAEKFPYVNKSIILVPIAWLHRFFTRGLSYLSSGKLKSYVVKGEDDLNDTAKKRVELFKQMKII